MALIIGFTEWFRTGSECLIIWALTRNVPCSSPTSKTGSITLAKLLKVSKLFKVSKLHWEFCLIKLLCRLSWMTGYNIWNSVYPSWESSNCQSFLLVLTTTADSSDVCYLGYVCVCVCMCVCMCVWMCVCMCVFAYVCKRCIKILM